MAEIDIGRCGMCDNFLLLRLKGPTGPFSQDWGNCANPFLNRVIIVHRKATPRQSLRVNNLTSALKGLIRSKQTCLRMGNAGFLARIVEIEEAANQEGTTLYLRA